MSDELTKRKYSSPRIVRIELSHEQAVLSVCSTTTTSLANMTRQFCLRPSVDFPLGCRNSSDTANDSAQSS